jgi:uncharacterized peroxidase-related enzyme
MQTLTPVNPAEATGRAKELLDLVKQRTGRIPNMVRLMANSPASLAAYLNFANALQDSALPPPLRALVSIAVAAANRCDYTLAAISVLAKRDGLSEDDIAAARYGEATDSKSALALQFATKMVKQRGHLAATEVEALRGAGFSDAEVTEIVALVALNIYRSYFNLIAGPEIDFPPAAPVPSH